MIRFNTIVLTLAAGALLGTVLQPGLIEIAIVTAVVCGTASLLRRPAAARHVR